MKEFLIRRVFNFYLYAMIRLMKQGVCCNKVRLMIIIISLIIVEIGYAQFHRTDSVGNFYVDDNQLIWEKYFPMQDENDLDQQLKSNHFSSNLDILRFRRTAMSKPTQLTASNLPEYARGDFEAFIVVDFKGDQYRISIKNITFPKFVESYYYNGRKQYTGRGTLNHYLLRPDKVIKRNSGTYNVMDSFDAAFMEIFSPNVDGY